MEYGLIEIFLLPWSSTNIGRHLIKNHLVVCVKFTKTTLTLKKLLWNMIHSLTSMHQYVHHYSELQLKDVLPFMIEKQISPALPNLSILYKIYLLFLWHLLLLKEASAEKKLIKSYFRSTMSYERLSGLALLSIERDYVNWQLTYFDFETSLIRR